MLLMGRRRGRRSTLAEVHRSATSPQGRRSYLVVRALGGGKVLFEPDEDVSTTAAVGFMIAAVAVAAAAAAAI
jgi:hypothetical protein